jgi:hypothetical protein
MDLNARRLATAEELYQKLNICGPHFNHTVSRQRVWVLDGDTAKRSVDFEEEIGGGQYDEHSGSFSVTFEKGTSLPGATFTQIGDDLTFDFKGEELQAFLREYLPSLKSPFTTAIHVKVSRNYAADHAELSKQGIGAVTTKAMAQHMLAPFQSEFGTISALSFRRNDDNGTYEIEIRLPLADFPDAGTGLSEFSPEQLDEAVKAGEAFEARLKKAIVAGTQIGFGQTTIKTPKHSYVWWDVLEAQRTYDIRNGMNLQDFSADEVADVTVLQIGDHAVLEDGAADCYVVAWINEDGLCDPIKGDLSLADAEAMLNELAAESGPVYQAFSA